MTRTLEKKSNYTTEQTAAILHHDRQNFSDWRNPELRNILLKGQDFHVTERVANETLSAGLVVAVWGDRHDETTLTKAVNEHVEFMEREFGRTPTGDDMTGRTGFTENYWTRAVTKSELLPLQVAVGVEMAKAAVEKSGLKPDEITKIKKLRLAVSAPASLLLARYIAEELGIEDYEIVSAACNSFARAIEQGINEAETPNELSLTLGIETMMAMRWPMSSEWQGTTNKTALSFFSDGAVAFVGKLGRFRKLFEVKHEEKDTAGALAAINTAGLAGAHISELEWDSEFGTVVELPIPPNGEAMNMKARETTEFFIKFIRTLTDKFKSDGGEDFLKKELPTKFYKRIKAIGHRPSRKLREKFARELEKLGLPEGLFEWNGNYGNGPCIIWGHEMAGILESLQPGDILLQYFFGGGATGQIRFDEII